MTTDNDNIPTIDNLGEVPIDVDALIVSKLLASANSGGGKSRMLRRIAEQTWGHAQHIFFDVEGDFHTLRERFPYLLFGPGGDAPLTVEIAGKLILRLLETGASAILDLSELPVLDGKDGGDQRAVFIQKGLQAAINAPKELWHPTMFFLDEIHLWAPETGVRTAVSTAAVIDFFTRGRKRAFCGIAATQRIAELHKTVVAECNNRLIGRTGLDVDQTRAAKNLGMRANIETFQMLQNMEPGEFFAFGPALSKQVIRIRSGTVATTHPTAGHRAMAPTPARKEVRKLVEQFRDLPKEVAKEENELETLRARIRTLEADKSGLECDLENLKTNQQHRDEVQGVINSSNLEIQGLRDVNAQHHARIQELERQIVLRDEIEDDLVNELRVIADRATHASNIVINRLEDAVAREAAQPAKPATFSDDTILAARKQARAGASVGTTILATLPTTAEQARQAELEGAMSEMERNLLTVIAQYTVAGGSTGITKQRVLIYATYSASGHTAKAFARLAEEGWVEKREDGGVGVTLAGIEALGTFPRTPPTKLDLRKKLVESLEPMAGKILTVFCSAYPAALSKKDSLEKAGYAPSGHTSKTFGYLKRAGYITKAGAKIQASEALF